MKNKMLENVDLSGSVYTIKKGLVSKQALCDSVGIRTQDPIIKSDVLYQLSYEINSLSLQSECKCIIIFLTSKPN